MIEFLPPPDLVIYLRATPETLLERMAQRNRDYERGISRDYLDSLNELYDQWIDGFTLCPVLTVPADQLNYVARPHASRAGGAQNLRKVIREGYCYV